MSTYFGDPAWYQRGNTFTCTIWNVIPTIWNPAIATSEPEDRDKWDAETLRGIRRALGQALAKSTGIWNPAASQGGTKAPIPSPFPPPPSEVLNGEALYNKIIRVLVAQGFNLMLGWAQVGPNVRAAYDEVAAQLVLEATPADAPKSKEAIMEQVVAWPDADRQKMYDLLYATGIRRR